MEAELLADYWREPRPVVVRGDGVWLFDAAGNRYLDAASSVHVVSIGHGVKEIAEAISSQAAKVSFASTRHFANEPQLELAGLIADMAPEGLCRCYFASGGSEAMELALQMACYWQALRGSIDKTTFIGQWRSYHGGTIGTVSLGGHVAHRRRLAYHLLPFPHMSATPADNGDPQHFATKLDELILRVGPDRVCAFVAEPISGTTSGAIVPPPGWYEAIREVCDEHEILFIADEVVTGFGRTGRDFGIQHWTAIPDILVTSKGISSGYAPLAAVIVHNRLADSFQAAPERLPLRLTYAGNPLACAAGLAVQRRVKREHLVDRCRDTGEHLRGLLEELSNRVSIVGTPRGRGLLLGVPIWRDTATQTPFPRETRMYERIVERALGHGLILVGGAGTDAGEDGDHLLISPPFVISHSECEQLVDMLETVVSEILLEESA
jgi:adenosylmethionine-8-amino-7-oxononanoate aminotransferase